MYFPDHEMTVKAPDAVIANGASLSNAIKKSHYRRVLLFMPSAWTAADITFAVSDSPTGTFNKLVYGTDEGEVTIKASADEVIALDGKVLDALEACPYFKIRSGTADVAVNQLAERTIGIVLAR
jgi:hypothetical protein